MARCEDYPCCGHEAGCCPDFDDDGKQLNMVCTCGAKLPVDAPYSICQGCMRRMDVEEADYDNRWDEDREDDDDEESDGDIFDYT